MKIAFLGCLLLLPLGSAVAQRKWSAVSYEDLQSGNIFVSHESRAVAEWTWTIGGTKSSGNLTLPPGKAGSATLLNSHTLLVSGHSGSEGWLAEIIFSISGSAVVANLAHVPNPTDVVNLAYLPTAGAIVGVDHDNKELVAASYVPGLQVGPWEVIATASHCPLLGINSLALKIDPMPVGMGALLHARGHLDGLEAWVVSKGVLGDWSVAPQSAGMPIVSPSPAWLVSAYPVLTANSTAFELWIGGGSGDFCIADHESQEIVFVGHHFGSSGGQLFSIPYWSLHQGRLYRVQSLSVGSIEASVPFVAEIVWPRASVDPHMLPSKVEVRWDFPAVGTDFVSWEMYWRSSAPQPTESMLLTMTVGAWNFGVNPTMAFLDVEVLAAPFGTLGVQAASWDNRGVVSFGWLFAVNNPALTGLKVAMQAVGVLPSGQFVVSDVVGVLLVP
jgi:hypothetical protein